MTGPTPHFTINNGAIRSGGNARSLESLLIQAQQLEIASRTTPNDYVQTKRADLRDCWRQLREAGR